MYISQINLLHRPSTGYYGYTASSIVYCWTCAYTVTIHSLFVRHDHFGVNNRIHIILLCTFIITAFHWIIGRWRNGVNYHHGSLSLLLLLLRCLAELGAFSEDHALCHDYLSAPFCLRARVASATSLALPCGFVAFVNVRAVGRADLRFSADPKRLATNNSKGGQ